MPFAAIDNQVLDPSWNGVKGATGEGFPKIGDFDKSVKFKFGFGEEDPIEVTLRGAVMRGPTGSNGPSGYMHATWWPYTKEKDVVNPGKGNQKIWRNKYYIPQGVLGRDASGNLFPTNRYVKGTTGRYSYDGSGVTMEISGNIILTSAKNGVGGNLKCENAVVSTCCSEDGEVIIFADNSGSLKNGKIDNTTTTLTRQLIGGLARTHGAAKVETFYITFSPKSPEEGKPKENFHLLSSTPSENVGMPLFKDEHFEFGWNYTPMVDCGGPNGPQIKLLAGDTRWFLNTWRNSFFPIATRLILQAGMVAEPVKNCLFGGEKACGTISAEHKNPDFRKDEDKTQNFYPSSTDNRYVAKIDSRKQMPTYNFTYHVCGNAWDGVNQTSATLRIEKIWNP